MSALKIFVGDDRVRAQAEIRKRLGGDYEVIEGGGLTPEMMPSVFWGASLLCDERKIVIKDLSENKESFAKLGEYANTAHRVIVWESKLDKRTVTYKELMKAGVEIKEFKLAVEFDYKKVFGIYDMALRDGRRAVKMLEEVQEKEEPQMFVGLMATQALRGFVGRPNEKRRLKELAKLDLELKSSGNNVEPWDLVKSFLLRIKQI